MTKEFSQKDSYLALKAHENMIAFVGFYCDLDNRQAREGVVKVSSSPHQPYGRTHLTLTFIVDTTGDESLRAELERAFEALSDADFEPYLGRSLEKVVTVSLDSLAEIQGWYIEEVNIHLRSPIERESVLIQERILPALDCALGFRFEAVQWWPQGRQRTPMNPKSIGPQSSPRSLFQRWFGLK